VLPGASLLTTGVHMCSRDLYLALICRRADCRRLSTSVTVGHWPGKADVKCQRKPICQGSAEPRHSCAVLGVCDRDFRWQPTAVCQLRISPMCGALLCCLVAGGKWRVAASLSCFKLRHDTNLETLGGCYPVD